MPENMIDKIHWLGHDGFRVDGSRTLYFDPWEVTSDIKADVIMISHDHYDHCSPDDVAKLSKPYTVVVTEPESAKKLSGNVKTITPGQTIDVNGVKITGVPSYNTDKQFHPQQNNWLGFIAEIDGVKIYHAGDTDFIPEMKKLDVDIALLPVSGTYVMTADQAIQAARAIKPKIAIPMHYDKIVGTVSDAEKFANALKNEMTVVIKEKE
jgi:L-ascorbate metabolism protein UlaG (beta-lactamase superfamily)